MNNSTSTNKASLSGAIIAGALASSCCLGPLVVASLGLGSASMFVAMGAYRPLFGIITLALLGWAGWQHWKKNKQCVSEGCPPKKPILLCLLGGVAILFLVSPSLISYFR